MYAPTSSAPPVIPTIVGVPRQGSAGHRTRLGPPARPTALLVVIVLASSSLIASTGDGPCPPTLGGLDVGTANYDVTAGNGTAGNPYIIEDQVIYVGSGGVGIQRRNSDAYYLYRNITMIGTQSGSYGVICDGASNVTIDGLVLRTLTIPLYIVDCQRMRFLNVTVEDCFQGVRLMGTSDCTLVNVSLTGIESIGLSATGCSYLSFDGCSARDITGGGFAFRIFTAGGYPESRNISLVGCSASNAGLGLSFAGVEGGTIDGCNLTGGWPADVYCKDTRNLTMLDTALGAGGLWVVGTWTGLDVRGSNTVDGSPLRFIDGADGGVVNSSAGQVILVECQGAIVENLTFQGIAHPVTLLGSSGCTVRNCTFRDPDIAVGAREGGLNRVEDITILEGGYPYAPYGIDLAYGEMAIEGLNATGLEVAVHAVEGSHLDIANSSFADGRSQGILAEASQPQSGGSPTRELTVSRCRFQNVTQGIQATDWNLAVRDCRFEACGNLGVSATSTSSTAASGSKVLLERMEVVDCGYTGVYLDGISAQLSSLSVERSTRGIFLGSRVLCTIRRCNVSECGNGLVISSAFQVTVSECTFMDCTYNGIYVSNCNKANFHHNNLIRNNYDESSGLYTAPQALDTGGNNEWDDGAEGNYWADYQQRYPDATAWGRVWDTPYVISGHTTRRDWYPLTMRYDYLPPVADAGPDSRVPEGTRVTLDGSGSSDDIGIVEYAWTFIYSGKPVTYDTPVANHTFDVLGSYAISLTVKDAWGNVGTDVLLVHVEDMVPPVAVAPPDLTVEVKEHFELDGSDSHDDHGIATFRWTVDPGGLDILLEGVTVTLAIDAVGDYLVVLNVTDAQGNWATASLTVRVRDSTPPVPLAGPDVEVDQHTTVTFDGTASTDNVGIVVWEWSFETGAGGGVVTLEGPTATYTFDDAGEYIVHLRLSDAALNSAEDVLVVRVRDTEPPVADAGPDIVVDQNAAAVLDGSASRDNVGIARFRWTAWVDGASILLDGATVTLEVSEAGTFTVELEVTDATGNSATDTMVLRVRDVTAPRASAGPDIIVDQHMLVMLDGSGSTDDVGITTHTWTFTVGGVDMTLEGPQLTFTFDLVGSFLVTLTVADAAGNSATDALTVFVRDIEPPVAVAGPDRTVVQGDGLTLDATESHDNVGIISYVWTVVGEGGTETLTGPVVTVSTARPGTLRVEMRVTDAAGNLAYDTLAVQVLPLMVNWRLGPFTDGEGRLLQGVRVSVTLNGTERAGLTDDTGWLTLSPIRYDLVSPAQVTASKKGYDTLRFTTALDVHGDPVDPVPVMRRRPETGVSPGVVWTVIVAVLVAVAVVVALRERARARTRRGGAGGAP